MEVKVAIPRITTGHIKDTNYFIEKGYLVVQVTKRPRTDISYTIDNLLPDDDLFDDFINSRIDRLEFSDKYKSKYSDEYKSSLINKLACLASFHDANTIVIVTGGSYMKSYRSLIAELLNESGLLTEKVEEIFNYKK